MRGWNNRTHLARTEETIQTELNTKLGLKRKLNKSRHKCQNNNLTYNLFGKYLVNEFAKYSWFTFKLLHLRPKGVFWV